MRQRIPHSKTLEILQTRYDNNIIDYTRLTSKVVLLHFSDSRYSSDVGFAVETNYLKLAIQNGETFKILKSKFTNVSCEKNGTITAEKIIFGLKKKIYLDKTGRRISKPENY